MKTVSWEKSKSIEKKAGTTFFEEQLWRLIINNKRFIICNSLEKALLNEVFDELDIKIDNCYTISQ